MTHAAMAEALSATTAPTLMTTTTCSGSTTGATRPRLNARHKPRDTHASAHPNPIQGGWHEHDTHR